MVIIIVFKLIRSIAVVLIFSALSNASAKQSFCFGS